jgi:hypothetical protein
MSALDGGPAFPRMGEGFGNPNYDTPGMSLRDYFAAHALPALIEQNGHISRVIVFDVSAKEAYAYADAMLQARQELTQ